jgi:hypothetical protein
MDFILSDLALIYIYCADISLSRLDILEAICT